MQKGDKLVIIREVDTDPLTSDVTRMIAALAALGILLDEDCPYQDTREMVAGAEQRVITWVLKARSECARFNTHEMIVAWNDPDFAAKQPEHPFGYIKAAFKNYSRALEFVEGQIPLALLRKGRRMALIPMDASVERRDELIAALES